MSQPVIVCMGGTTRPTSITERVLRLIQQRLVSLGARVEFFSGKDLLLPMYAPERTERTEQARRLVTAWRACDSLVIASPGYHGAVSGLVKNALDYTEDIAKDQQAYFDGRAVACVATALHWDAVGTTLVSMRAIVHALRGWPTPLGVAINTTTPVFDESGACAEPIQNNLDLLADQVFEFASRRAAYRELTPIVPAAGS
jgi:FMN reductase